jgi:hypothetical protein
MVAYNMLDHQKIILENVIDNRELFQKEFKKSLSWLDPDDIKKLYIWLKENFWDTHEDTLYFIFNKLQPSH